MQHLSNYDELFLVLAFIVHPVGCVSPRARAGTSWQRQCGVARDWP
ncbi:MAG: hypothetical protein WCE20_14730 [Rhizomicrobium sp.]